MNYVPSGYYRAKARAALKGRWQTALLIALIVNLPTLLIQGFSAYTGNDVLTRLNAVIVEASRDGLLTQQILANEIDAIMNSTSFWTVRGLELAAWLITPCLVLGMYSWMIDRLRGQDGPVNTVFCRMKLFFRAIGLQLLIILKVLLWALPGAAAAAAVAYTQMQSSASQAAAFQGIYAMSLPLSMLMIVPAVMAALRYGLAEYIMAEKPETGILASIRRSKELMKDRKKFLFFLMFSFLLWYMLELLISSFLTGMLSQLFQMLAGLALSVYMSCSVAAFYLQAQASGGSPEAEPAPDELN